MIRNNPAHDVLTPPGTVHSDMGPLTRSIDDFQEQVRDYYERRQHMNTTQRGKLAEELRKADAPLPSVDWESRYNRLVGALTGLASQLDNDMWWSAAERLRDTLKENT